MTIDDRVMTDADWVRLTKVMSKDVPTSHWPLVSVKKGEGLYAIIDRFYDIYPLATTPGARALPQTVSQLMRIIATENDVPADGLREGQTLRVPPLPVRPQMMHGGAPSDALRLFVPGRDTYAVLNAAGAVKAAGTRQPNRDAAAISSFRSPGKTVFSVSSDAAFELALAGVGTSFASKTVSLELLDAPTACELASSTLPTSPYLARARQRLNGGSGRVVAAAAKHRLAFIDFDFADGHGGKVRSAARWVLNVFGQSALDSSLVNVELNPAALRAVSIVPDQLSEPIAKYWAWGKEKGVVESGVQDGTMWLVTSDPGVGQAVYEVPPVLLQAVIFDRLQRGQWLSLSWRITEASGALPIDAETLLAGNDAFVVVAAGNEAAQIRSDRTPQSAASSFKRFVNVTHGDRTGAVFGSWTSDQGGNVDLIAQGCGFEYGTLHATSTGSSFAAPVVAVSAWLKHLVDGTPGDSMRPLLARASSLLRLSNHRVLSGGYFDPAQLIANVGPHYVTASGTDIVEIADVELKTDACGTFRSGSAAPGTIDVAIYDSAGTYQLIRRSTIREHPYVRVEPACTVHTLEMRATRGHEPPLVISTPREFIQLIRQATF